MLKNALLATVAGLALGLPVIAQDAPAEVTRDSVVATVNGTEITLGELVAAAARLPAQYQQLPPDVLFSGLVDQLVQQQLLADTVETAPSRVAITLANEERSLLAGEAVSAILASAASEEEIQAEYDQMFDPANAQTEYSAAHILVPTEEEALAVLERLNAGEEFAALAQELSQDPGSGANGGDLGWFPAGAMVEPFNDAVIALADGATTEAPVQSEFGWHIIHRNGERVQEAPPLEAVRGQIEAALQNAAVEGAIVALEEGADVVRPAEGAFDPTVILNLDLLED